MITFLVNGRTRVPVYGPVCAKCGKATILTVRRVVDGFRFDVECHGAVETMTLTDEEMQDVTALREDKAFR